ncbi:hypothetical protein ACT3RX_15710 [Halomonas sp. AOP42-E1-40]|uniref:hypothetical protein n=1 Tax=Vreelandella zhanjiangensis TaxID=1121960 RepID=UPI00402AD2E1
MIKPLASKLIKASQIEISGHITHDILKTLMLRPPLLRDARDLTEQAIKLAILLSPPVVYETKSNGKNKSYICVGNFRSLELAKRLSSFSKIRVNLIEPPLQSDTDKVVIKLNMSSDIALSLDPEKAASYFLELRTHTTDNFPEVLSSISLKCKFKKSFLEALGINRKRY